MNTETKSIFKYLRELSIVVAGIAITFSVSNLIGVRNENKDMQRYLYAVKLELEDNMKLVKEKAAYYDKSRELSRYLISDKPENLSRDTLSRFDNILGHMFYLSYKKSAFEMFKTSGAMRLMKDKELLTSIWNSYSILEESKEDSDEYMRVKTRELYDLFTSVGYQSDLDIRDVKNRRIFNFYTHTPDLNRQLYKCADRIEQTLSMF